MRFANLWGMENGQTIKWQRFTSIDREYLLYGNGENRHISIVLDTNAGNENMLLCNVTLRPGTGENQ